MVFTEYDLFEERKGIVRFSMVVELNIMKVGD